jgi:hypothetical protein
MEHQRHLFLDLEDTVIEPIPDAQAWSRTRIINEEKIRRFIEEFQPAGVHIFSFAIWNEHERKNFNRWLRLPLEIALKRELRLVLRVDEDIIPNAVSVRCPGMMGVSFSEMSNYWGKEETFRYNIRELARTIWKGIPIDAVLIDDCVVTEEWELPALQLKGRTINIEELEGYNENNSRTTSLHEP